MQVVFFGETLCGNAVAYAKVFPLNAARIFSFLSLNFVSMLNRVLKILPEFMAFVKDINTKCLH